MIEDSLYKDALVTQIREACGRIIYTYTAHLKLMDCLVKKNNRIIRSQIILSAISAGGFIGPLIVDEPIWTYAGSVCSTALLAINLFFKKFNLFDEINQHRVVSDELWLIREQYVSLLTDACVLTTEDIILRRDDLQNKTYKIYKKYPKTNAKSYAEAQKALKSDEEQLFTEEELDKMLPPRSRVTNQNSSGERGSR